MTEIPKNNQLNLFEPIENNISLKHFLCIFDNNLVFKNGIKYADFVVYNPLNIDLKNEDFFLHEILLKEDKFWNEIKSMTWSSNCRYFFVINENHIIIGNTLNNKAFLSNLSLRIFEEFFIAHKVKHKLSN